MNVVQIYLEAFDCFAMKQISSVLGKKLLTFKLSNVKRAYLVLESLPFKIVMLFVAIETFSFRQQSWFTAIIKRECSGKKALRTSFSTIISQNVGISLSKIPNFSFNSLTTLG